MSLMKELKTPRPVLVTSETLPPGVRTVSRKGDCIGWWWNDENHFWLVVFDETGETVWVPQHEIQVRSNWSAGRRYDSSVRKEIAT